MGAHDIENVQFAEFASKLKGPLDAFQLSPFTFSLCPTTITLIAATAKIKSTTAEIKIFFADSGCSFFCACFALFAAFTF